MTNLKTVETVTERSTKMTPSSFPCGCGKIPIIMASPSRQSCTRYLRLALSQFLLTTKYPSALINMAINFDTAQRFEMYVAHQSNVGPLTSFQRLLHKAAFMLADGTGLL